MESAQEYDEEELRRFQLIRRAEEIGLCVWDCPYCGGVGWMGNERGIVSLCPNVDPFKIPGWMKRIGLSRNEVETLKFQDIKRRGNVQDAVRAVIAVLQRGHGWVYLWGDYGVGKTMILQCAVAHAMRKKVHASYIRMTDLLDKLRDAFDDSAPPGTYSEIENWYLNVPILAIDEINRMNETPWATERRFSLMDYRYQLAINGENNITIIASNEPPDRLPGYLADRIEDGRFTVIHLTGDSARPAMKWE